MLGEVIGIDERDDMGVEALLAFILKGFYGGFLDRKLHAFRLAAGPGVVGLAQAMLGPVLLADPIAWAFQPRRVGPSFFHGGTGMSRLPFV